MAEEKVVNQEPASETIEQVRARVSELEARLAAKDEELAQATNRLTEMEKTVAKSEQGLAQAVGSYRALAVKAHPGIPEELINGGTIEEVDAAVTKATSLVNKVKQGLAAETATARVPAGAPVRTGANLQNLTPREKIQYAIGGRK